MEKIVRREKCEGRTYRRSVVSASECALSQNALCNNLQMMQTVSEEHLQIFL